MCLHFSFFMLYSFIDNILVFFLFYLLYLSCKFLFYLAISFIAKLKFIELIQGSLRMSRGRKKGTTFENGYNKNADTFTFLMYPDSAKENWEDFLFSHFDYVSISPLHNKDFQDNGEPKKAHWHVVVKIGHKIKADKFKSFISDNIGGVFPPLQSEFIVSDVKQVIRYGAHLDEFDKPKYDIHYFKVKGFDLNAYLNDCLDLKNYCSIEILHLLYSNNPLSFMEWVSDIVKLGNDYLTCFFGRQQTFSNAWRDYEKNFMNKENF